MDDALRAIYSPDVPGFLREAAESPELIRLKEVGMNCGCEYTSFPRFRDLAPYSRYAHSVGVGHITWRFTGDARASLAALAHDIATPCFAHVIDFLNGDYLRQESTEDGTARLIGSSGAIQRVLRALGLHTADVSDYHAYPIADNDTPRLSADRLEYTLGNLVNFGLSSLDEVRAMYENLRVAANEDGAPELAFRDADAARRFALLALECSRIYVSDADRVAMQYLAELLGEAIAAGVVARADLWGTEPELIARLEADPIFREKWRAYRALNATERRAAPGLARAGEGWRIIPAKKRWIDPLVCPPGSEAVRVSAISPDFARAARSFLEQSQAETIRAFTR